VFGEVTNEEVKTMPDISAREILIFAPIIFCVLWIGLYPKPYLHAMEASVQKLIKQTNVVGKN
jgi:NADH-quinone oxidoreductase subunit M